MIEATCQTVCLPLKTSITCKRWCPDLLLVAMIKHWPKPAYRRKWILLLLFILSVVSPSSMKTRIGTPGTWRRELEQRPWRGWRGPSLLPSSLSGSHSFCYYTAQSQLPRDGPHKTTRNQENASRDIPTGHYDKDNPSTEVCSDWLCS